MTQERLAVWLGDEPVGELAREGRRFDLRFRRRSGARARLTVADAGATDAWTPAFTRAWFDGLLPEEARRTAVPDAVARRTIEEALALLHDGITAASERHPGAPAEMVAAVRAQLTRVSDTSW